MLLTLPLLAIVSSHPVLQLLPLVLLDMLSAVTAQLLVSAHVALVAQACQIAPVKHCLLHLLRSSLPLNRCNVMDFAGRCDQTCGFAILTQRLAHQLLGSGLSPSWRCDQLTIYWVSPHGPFLFWFFPVFRYSRIRQITRPLLRLSSPGRRYGQAHTTANPRRYADACS